VGKGSGGNGMTRGDRRRNARRERLRGLLPRGGAVIGIDLAEDKQALAVIDHDVRVLARKTVKVKAFRLGQALDWAAAQAKVKGFERVTVACEPTGPRWMQVQRLCAERGLPLVCVQPLVSHIAREQQDYTPHKTDPLTELPGEVPQVSGRMGVLVATVADHDHRRRCAAGPVPAGDAAGRVA
jgi:transposase